MKQSLNQIPGPLRKVILFRFITCGVALLMLCWVLLILRDWKFAIPCLAVAIVFFVAGLQLLADCTENNYITLKGVCSEVERTGLRKRIKSICIKCGELSVRFPNPDCYSKTLKTGDYLEIYVSCSAPVYEMDGYQVICNTLAIGKLP